MAALEGKTIVPICLAGRGTDGTHNRILAPTNCYDFMAAEKFLSEVRNAKLEGHALWLCANSCVR
eukprot:1954501-Prymnesium_polylepis.1